MKKWLKPKILIFFCVCFSVSNLIMLAIQLAFLIHSHSYTTSNHQIILIMPLCVSEIYPFTAITTVISLYRATFSYVLLKPHYNLKPLTPSWLSTTFPMSLLTLTLTDVYSVPFPCFNISKLVTLIPNYFKKIIRRQLPKASSLWSSHKL